jgi:mono/diheme cytochrome c family protein
MSYAGGWLLVVTVLVGCVSTVPRVDTGLVQIARQAQFDADTERLQAGYEAYRNRCVGCHQLVPPGEHAVDAWPALVADHRDRFQLTDSEAALIALYLQAGRLAHEQRMEPREGDASPSE